VKKLTARFNYEEDKDVYKTDKVEGETKIEEQNREALFNMEKIVRILKANISARNLTDVPYRGQRMHANSMFKEEKDLVLFGFESVKPSDDLTNLDQVKHIFTPIEV